MTSTTLGPGFNRSTTFHESSPSELAADTRHDPAAMGPHDLVASEWVVQLTDESIEAVRSLESIDELLDRNPVDFTAISGLGSEGLVLLRGRGVAVEDVRNVLESSGHVERFNANTLVTGQMLPNDPEFTGGLLPGLPPSTRPAPGMRSRAACAWSSAWSTAASTRRIPICF